MPVKLPELYSLIVLCLTYFLAKNATFSRANCADSNVASNFINKENKFKVADHVKTELEQWPVFLSHAKDNNKDTAQVQLPQVDDEEASTEEFEEKLDTLEADDSPEELEMEMHEKKFTKKKHEELNQQLKEENPQLRLLMDELIQLSISLRDLTHQIDKL